MNLWNLQITLDYKCSYCYYMNVVIKNFLSYKFEGYVLQVLVSKGGISLADIAGLGQIKKPKQKKLPEMLF